MPINITLPRLGWSMEEGKFLAWLKKDGDFIKEGDSLFTLESDKAAQEVEAIDSGLLHIAPDGPKPGDVIKVGHVLGYLLAEGETPPATPPKTSPTDSENPQIKSSNQTIFGFSESVEKISPSQSAGLLESAGGSSQPPASPRARRAAKEHRVDLARLTPTGNGGRIRERDVLASATSTTTSGMKQVPLTPLRRTIAARLMHSRQTTVPVTITARCDATALLAFRQQLKSITPSLQHSIQVVPTINDIFVKLAAAALRQHRMLAESIHLGIAVDTEAGLLVPVIRDVGTSTLTQIAAQSQRLIAAARAGQLAAADMQGACFTLSNLGSLGVEAFTPVINPPESAILGIGAIVREAVPLDDGTFAARDRLTLSLTFDHRVNDGAAAARFLQTLRHLIEHPLLGLV
jgi:pyruvate dehydrogenase E2 component (dihydrolipoamide acetyltransferase)